MVGGEIARGRAARDLAPACGRNAVAGLLEGEIGAVERLPLGDRACAVTTLFSKMRFISR